jgi:hypothetical protein
MSPIWGIDSDSRIRVLGSNGAGSKCQAIWRGRFREVKPPSWLALEGGALPITSRLQLTAFSWKLLLRVTAGCNVSRNPSPCYRPQTSALPMLRPHVPRQLSEPTRK